MLGPALVQAVDFKRDIAPILKKHCYECHSEETGKNEHGTSPADQGLERQLGSAKDLRIALR